MATTSNSYSFTETASSLVNDVSSKLGFIGEGETLTSGEYNIILRASNRTLKSLMPTSTQNGSIKMWQRHRGYLFLSANSGQYTLNSGSPYWTDSFLIGSSNGKNAPGATTVNVASTTGLVQNPSNANNATGSIVQGMMLAAMMDNGEMFYTTVSSVPTGNTITIPSPGLPVSCNTITNLIYFFQTSSQPPQEIEGVILRDINGNDVSMKELDYEEWFNLPSKQAPGFAGDPIAYYYEPHLTGTASGSGPYGYFFTDVNQAQDLTKYCVIAYIREIQDLVNPSDLIEIPKEYYKWLLYEVAYDVSDDFNVVWTPQLEKKRIMAWKAATKANPMKSSRGFMPGDRGWNIGREFNSR